MDRWATFPFACAQCERDLGELRRLWPRLHRGDCEPWPKDEAAQRAWQHYHAGRFRQAFDAGLAAGGAGLVCANKAQVVHGRYLEGREPIRLARWLAVVERGEAHLHEQARQANAWFWPTYALGLCSISLSIPRARALGLLERVKLGLDTTLRLQPQHADATLALAHYHAELIAKLGRRVARGLGADAATALQLYARAQQLNPASAIVRIERANGLVLLEGERRLAEADALCAEAAEIEPLDAAECLHRELARAELATP
jgi:hypothetical protein